MKQLPIALQLYTLRDYTDKDFIGTLEKVASMGYKGVEFAGFGGLSAPQLKAELDRLNLKAVGSHVGLDQLEKDLDGVIDYHLGIGCKYIIVPYFQGKGAQSYADLGKKLDVMGSKCREKGITLGYHNHAHEFEVFDGKYGLDYILGNASPLNLSAEVDTYWSTKAGIDTIDYLSKLKGRLPLVHIKDMEAETKDFAEIGEGIIDIPSIARAAAELGSEWLIVEQDACKRPAIESVEISINNLRKMGLA